MWYVLASHWLKSLTSTLKHPAYLCIIPCWLTQLVILGNFTGLLFCAAVLSKFFKVHDALIGLFSSFFHVMAILGLLLADDVWQLYLRMYYNLLVILCEKIIK